MTSYIGCLPSVRNAAELVHMQTKCSIQIGWFYRHILKNVLTISKEFKDWEMVLPTVVKLAPFVRMRGTGRAGVRETPDRLKATLVFC